MTVAALHDIRPLGADDGERYRALWRAGIVGSPECFRISEEDTGATEIPTRGTVGSFTLGAFAGDALVGVVSLERDALRKLRHKALLFRMYVAPQAAGFGVGRALLERTLDDARRAAGLRQIHLTVLATNLRAIRLYASLGFAEFAREPQAVEIAGDYVDELRMVRFL
jgi:cyclohexyl-isocyanide hydratase